MDLSRIILGLRREQGYTQENPAEMLGVSAAAISKWETGCAYPDITLLPQLAEIFHVSIDYLFSYEIEEKKTIPEVTTEANRLLKEKKHDEAIALIAKTLTRYPNNSKLMFELGRYKFMSAQSSGEWDKKFQEAADCFHCVVQNTEDDHLRAWAYHFLSTIAIINEDYDQAHAYNSKIVVADGLYPKAE